MFLRIRTYAFIALLSVLWHSCKDPAPIAFHQDVTDQISSVDFLSTLNPAAAMLTTVDSSGWRIIDTGYTAMALLSDIRYDSGSTQRHLVLSKIIVQDKEQPAFTGSPQQFLGFKGLKLDEASANGVPMNQKIRSDFRGFPDVSLGYQYTLLDTGRAGFGKSIDYPTTGVFNWTIQIPGHRAVDVGGIPSEIVRMIQPSPDSIARIDRSKDYTVKWSGPNNSVDLVISEIIGSTLSLKLHVNFQRATSDTAVISSVTLQKLLPAIYLFTISASSETTSDVEGIPIALRIASVHNVVVRMQ